MQQYRGFDSLRTRSLQQNKSKLPIDLPKIALAMERAKAMNPSGPILTTTGMEVFKIIEDLVQLKVVDIRT